MKPSRLVSSVFVVLMLALAVTILLRGKAPVVPASRADSSSSQEMPAMPGSAAMRPAKAAERSAAIASIQAQLRAFARDDYPAAMTYQSDDLRNNFPSAEAFRHMIQGGYPEFAHYKSVQFGKSLCNPIGQQIEIMVTLTGQNGVTVHAVYLMVREGKAYRVAGVLGGVPLDNTTAPAVVGKDV